jgi:hypothetical protein
MASGLRSVWASRMLRGSSKGVSRMADGLSRAYAGTSRLDKMLKAGTRPESPTTARELDFDDEDVSASPKAPRQGATAEATQGSSGADVPPPQPPRPLDPRKQAENTLREAFPTIDVSVIKAVLMASDWRLEPAFNALLSRFRPPPPWRLRAMADSTRHVGSGRAGR